MKKKNRGFFSSILLLVYIFLLLLTFAGAIAPFLDVSIIAIIQFMPVGISFLIPVHLFASWFWGRESRSILVWALIAFGLSIWVGHKDFRLPQKDQSLTGNLTVVSFNVRTFEYQTARVDEAADLLKAMRPDVVCLQEFRNHQVTNDEKADSYLAKKLGMEYFEFVTLPIHIHGAAIFSKYPILNIDTLYISRKEINSGILATIQTPSGKVGVANLHMSSYNMEGLLNEHPEWKDRLLNLPLRFGKTLRLQQEQVNVVLNKIKTYPYPLVIAADMNSAPHTRIASQFSQRMTDSFIKQGSGIGWTYPLLGPLGVRIDYQFSSPELEVLTHHVIRSDVSDHYPIVATYVLQP